MYRPLQPPSANVWHSSAAGAITNFKFKTSKLIKMAWTPIFRECNGLKCIFCPGDNGCDCEKNKERRPVFRSVVVDFLDDQMTHVKKVICRFCHREWVTWFIRPEEQRKRMDKVDYHPDAILMTLWELERKNLLI